MALVDRGEVHKRAFVWGGLPGELVKLKIIKQRAGILEAQVAEVLEASPQRIDAADPEIYISTSPWQIYDFDYEQQLKIEQIKLAFAQQKIAIQPPEMKTDRQIYGYRNKMEYTFWWNNETEQIELAVYRRGTKGKIATDTGSSLALAAINQAALDVVKLLNQKQLQARQLKTLLLRADQSEQVIAQLYVIDRELKRVFDDQDFEKLNLNGFEVIYSDPRSPASKITDRLTSFGQTKLTDSLFNKTFSYPAESFFQINLPVYQLALSDIAENLLPDLPVVDFYSGVGTIGLSVADANTELKLIEINPAAVDEMAKNINRLGYKKASAVLSASENATEFISRESTLIVDPPRAGLHTKMIDQILTVKPKRLIYLSCNPVTQARDVAVLQEKYHRSRIIGYNFFPRTPHVESLVILDAK